MQNLISVIVCTYNQEQTVSRTLDSILRQRCHVPFEIIIGEDHSTDGTLAVCQHYAEQYPDKVRIIANNPNKGLVDNYYDCIFEAKGKYIADCAGDDYWIDPLKLEKEVTILEQHDDVGIVHTDWTSRPTLADTQWLSEKEASTHTSHCVITEGSSHIIDILTQTHKPVVHLCTALYRTEWARKVHDENIRFFRNNKAYPCEDIQITFFLARMGKFAYIPDKTLCYSIGESTSISNDEHRLFRFFSRATQLDYDLANTFGYSDPRISRFLQLRAFALIMHAFRCHDKDLLHTALDYKHQWQVSSDLRISIMHFICTFNPLWTLALLLRRIILLVK